MRNKIFDKKICAFGKKCKGDEKEKMNDKNIFLNNPIKNDDEDIFGVKIYVDSIIQSIKNGAKTIAVTSSFGGGKSSVFKLLEAKYGKEANYKFISINMWNQIETNTLDSLRKNFLYHLSFLIDNNTYITKVLSKNYGVIDLSFNFSCLEKILIGLIIIVFILIQWYKDLIYKIFQVFNIESKITDIIIFVFVVLAICTIVVKFLTNINIVFSSKNSENNRELEEVDYFRMFQQIVEMVSEKEIIIALEDMDRTNDYYSIIKFISEIKKFSDSYKGKKKITVIFAIKSEIELLKSISDIVQTTNNNENLSLSDIQKKYNVFYDKYFDYVVNIPKVNTIDFSNVLSNLIKSTPNVRLFCEKNKISIDEINKDFQWLIRGRCLTVRKLKERMNSTFLLYESIKENNPNKTVDLKKCAVSTYLSSEYPLIIFALKDDGLDYIITEFICNDKLSIESIDEIIDEIVIQNEEKELFLADIEKMMANGLVDRSYRFYLYNTPKNTEFLDIEETYVSNIILYDKKIENVDNDKINSVNESIIINSLEKYIDLGMGFPKNVFYNIRLFKLSYNHFNMYFQKELYNYLVIESNSLNSEQIRIIISDINNLVLCWEILEDAEGLLKLRKTLLKEFEGKYVDFEELYKYGNTLIDLDEIGCVNSIKCLYNLINFNSNKISFKFFEVLNNRIQEIVKKDKNLELNLVNEIYINIYKRIKDKEILVDYCLLLKDLKVLPIEFNNFLEENIDVFKEILQEYADIINNLEISSIDNRAIELINIAKEKVILSKDIIDKIYNLDAMYYLVLMIYNNYSFYINYSNELIQKTIENNINLFSSQTIEKIRDNVIIKDVDWKYLFESPNDFVSLIEISKSKDLLSSFKYIDKERLIVQYDIVYNYFYSLDTNLESVEIIYDYIFSLNRMEDVYKLLLSIDAKKIPFALLKKSNQNNKIEKLLNEISLSTSRKLELLEHLNILNSNVEKSFSRDDMMYGDFEFKYAALIKNSNYQKITKTTVNNIKKMRYLHTYNNKVEKVLLDNNMYLQYLYSNTKRNECFEFPFTEENEKLYAFCLNLFDGNDEKQEWIRKYMFNNKNFMNLVIENKKYKNISNENLMKMHKFNQDKNLLIYIVNKLKREQLLDYFSIILSFKDKDAMMYAVDYVINNNMCSNENVYRNLHDIAIDSIYKSKLTRCYNKTRF